MKFIILLLVMVSGYPAGAQFIQILTSDRKTSLRGLSAPSDKVIWVSGSNGTVGKSVDSGKNWEWITVKNYEKRDFRDIEAFDERTAVIMAVGEPANILKTSNGGKTWKLVFCDSAKGMFLDALDFLNNNSGIVVGDPVKGRFFLASTSNGGDDWAAIPFDRLPKADSGEACFAASGTNIRMLAEETIFFVSGGLLSRLFTWNKKIALPLLQGKQSTGANSLAFWKDEKIKDGLHLIVVGGDFARDTLSEKNCSLSDDGGLSWKTPLSAPHGYRSCVSWLGRENLICCGTSGVDISKDNGLTWKLISKESFHVCQKAKNGNSLFLAGSNGRIGKLVW
jgi:Photosynthesis system II assembly factor YCF48